MKQTPFIKIFFIALFFLTNTIYAQDADGDGIIDSVDLDDDNDGILDEDELNCSSGFIGLSKTFNDNISDPGTINGIYSHGGVNVDFKYELFGTAIWASGVKSITSGGISGDYINTQIKNSDFANGDVAVYTFSFSEPIYNFALKLGGFDNEDRADFVATNSGANVPITITDINLSKGVITGQTVYDINGTSGNAPSNSVQVSVNGGLDMLTITVAKNDGDSSNATIQIYDVSYCEAIHSDSDNIPNHLDIDDDNDGIPDNVEAQPTIGYIAPSSISSSIKDDNNNGLDDAYESAMGGKDLDDLEDTDRDGIKDYLDSDSDNDGTPDIEENGHANTLSSVDLDNDGLHDNLDSVTTHLDVNDEVTVGDVSDLTNSFGDSDSDTNLGGDLDYRDLFDVNPPEVATIDFDGVDDYLSSPSFINGLSNVTIMAWVKSDSGNSTDMVIAGEDSGCRLSLQSGKTPWFTVKTAGNTQVSISCSNINFDEWHHITGTYSSTTKLLLLYVDGELLNSDTVTNASAKIENTSNSNGHFEVGRLSSNAASKQYFKGDIDEIRVFDISLTTSQIQKMVYQEIKNNSDNVKGSIAAKNIDDTLTKATIPWDNLIAYYPMTNIVNNTTSDYSGYDKELFLNNISTIQVQTAPMPYVSANNTAWATESTWQHGDVWDIENIATNKDWSIVKIASNVSVNHTVKTLGLIVNSGSTLTISADNLLENSWYLELNGSIDLLGDSQLIQTDNSDLVSSVTGKILRRQEGTGSAYWYNYWASPVGELGVATLSNNNAETNNTNNSSFKIDNLKDGFGLNWPFTAGYTGNGSISTYWLYTFINGITYWDWAKLSTSTPIKPGIGYTQKGTGVGTTQQYIFEGKPNNGTILIAVDDKGGAGSVAGESKTDFLLGNPYPSAMDVKKFIDDNEGVINGTLQLWQQWSGASHNLRDYNGGYAQVNKLGGVRARQFVGLLGGTTGGEVGTAKPSQYLPVGQGFVTEIVATGTVEFNNNQRAFIKESDANGVYETGSVFFKNSGGKTKSKTAAKKEEDPNIFKKIRLEINSISGPAAHRELLLGFSKETSDGYDYGYDAENADDNNNDLHLSLDGKDMNMQAYSEITVDKIIPLNFKSSGSNSFEIKMTESENFEASEAIYLKDNFTGMYFDLTENTSYSFSSDQGKFNTRFEIVFQSAQQLLGTEETEKSENFVYYQNDNRKLYAKKLNASIKRLALVNMLGQSVLELQNVSDAALNNGIDIPALATGTYVAYFRSDNNEVFTKKMIIN